MEPWQRRGLRCGLRSSAALPICFVGKAEHALMIYSDSTGTFMRDVQRLLTSLAVGLGVALSKFRAEEQRGAARHQAILETAMYGFWMADTQGRLLEVNRTYCLRSGYRREELLAMRIQDLEAVETADETAAHIRVAEARGHDRFESRHRRMDGSVYEVEVSVRFQAADNGRFVPFLREITERKRAEAAEQDYRRHLERLVEERTASLSLRGELTRLEQALVNYLTNAIKFTETGRVTVRVRGEEDALDSVLVRFEVQDTGLGIAELALPRLFTAFEQIDPSGAHTQGVAGWVWSLPGDWHK